MQTHLSGDLLCSLELLGGHEDGRAACEYNKGMGCVRAFIF